MTVATPVTTATSQLSGARDQKESEKVFPQSEIERLRTLLNLLLEAELESASRKRRSVDIKWRISHHFVMRTTLTLDDDVLSEAAKRAELLNISLGKAVSDLARRGMSVAPPIREVKGLLMFDPPEGSPKITARKVKEELSDFP